MKVDMTQLYVVFDEQLSATDEEIGLYWLKATRADAISVILVFSIYENYVSVMIQNDKEIVLVSILMEDCSEIRILDEKKKCLEIVHTNNPRRCFISLLTDTIVNYSEYATRY